MRTTLVFLAAAIAAGIATVADGNPEVYLDVRIGDPRTGRIRHSRRRLERRFERKSESVRRCFDLVG